MASYVNADGVNCRSAPNTKARVVAKLRKGQSVSSVEGGGGWTKLEKPACWVSSRFLSSDYVAASTRGASNGYDSFRTNAVRSSRKQSSGNLYSFNSSPAKTKRKSRSSRSRKGRSGGSGYYSGSGCPCSGGTVCIGPRGGRYCITSGGNKRYGV
ncbi:SH3 domain-containing protein [Sphingobium sp.]|uniref:SH3 domain-containing protein n=1 Tax=Sphingobium sp. TaxID=1912891 RepID=UPI0039C9C93F